MRKTMKTLAIIGAVALALGLILSAGALAAADNGVSDGLNWLSIPARWERGSDGHLHFRGGSVDSYASVSMTYDAKYRVSALILKVSALDVELVPSDTLSAVRITYDQVRDDEFTITEEGGCLSFLQTGRVTVGVDFSFRDERGRVVVEYPAAQPFETIKAGTVSGELLSKVPTAGDVSFSTTSGDIRTEALKANIFEASTISGELNLGTVSAARIELASTSGDLRCKGLDADSVKVSTVSGKVSGAARCGKLTAGTTSGDISLSLDADDTTIGTTSGEIDLKLAPAVYRTDISTVSGDARIGDRHYDSKELPFKGHFTLEANGNLSSGTPDGARFLKISSTSGDFSIKLDK